MDTEIIMLRGALHDKEQELADLRKEYAKVLEAREYWMNKYNVLEQAVKEGE